MSEVTQTNIKGVVRSVSSVEALDALFAKIKATEPERYARLEAEGEYKNQLKVLGLAKAEPKPKAEPEAKEEKHKPAK